MPLVWAVQTCDAPFVEALIRAGANVKVKTKGGGPTLLLARVCNKTEIVSLLEKAGAK